jgi:hypothetical protein
MRRCNVRALREAAIWDAEEGEPVELTRILMGNEEFGSWGFADGFDADGDDLEIEVRTEFRNAAEWGVKVSVEREMPRDVVARLLRKAADLYDGPNGAQMDALTSRYAERGFARRRPDGSLCVSENIVEYCRETLSQEDAQAVASL